MPAEIPDGAVVVARALLNSSLWTMRPEDCKVAITCICLANWQPRKWWSGAAEITIQRGQFVASWGRLAVACQLSLQKVRTSISHLEKSGFLTRHATGRFSLFTVPKYEHYQNMRNYSDSAMVDSGARSNIASTVHQQVTNNKQEGKEGNNTKTHTNGTAGAGAPASVEKWRKDVESPDDGPPEFLRWWAAYPPGIRKQDRKAALAAWYRLAPSPELAESLIAVVKEQGKSAAWTADAGRFVPAPAKWLDTRGWEGTAEVVKARELAEQEKRQRQKEKAAQLAGEREKFEAEQAELAANPEKRAEIQARLDAAVAKFKAGSAAAAFPPAK